MLGDILAKKLCAAINFVAPIKLWQGLIDPHKPLAVVIAYN